MMKLRTVLAIVVLTLLQISVSAQVKYEATHQNGLNSIILDNGEMKYATFHKADKTMVLHNQDHTEWKSVPLHMPANLYFDELKSISLHVFNTDDLIELAYTCVEYIPNNDTEVTTEHVNLRHSLFIINEEGNIFLEKENCDHMEIVDQGGSRKLWVYSKDNIDVYALPDPPLSEMKLKQGDPGDYNAFGDRRGF